LKILITGFDPFGGESINPSYEAIKRIKLDNSDIELVTVEIPTVFDKCIDTLDRKIKETEPDIVICTGQAGGRFPITVERVGINIIDARIADNEGNQYIDAPIKSDGESAYFSNLPIKAIVKSLINNKIPAEVSNTAGTFVCNNILYGLLYLINTKYPHIKGGFIHVPFLLEQVTDKRNTPSMSLETITEAMKIIVETAAVTETDISEQGGAIC